MNQTQLVRSSINLLIVVAVSVSLFQELSSFSYSPQQQIVAPSDTQSVPLESTGPVINGIKILSTDKFAHSLKQILAKNKINVQLGSYTFDGNLYWINLFFNWGHIILIYFLMSKYKMENDDGKKKKLMILGALAVMAWFYISANLKPQALAVQVHGSKVYDKDYLNQKEVVQILNEYEIQIDDMNQAAVLTGAQKIDAWEEKQKEIKGQVKVEIVQDQKYIEEVF